MRDVLDDDLAELYAVRGGDDVRLARLREQLFAEKPRPRSRRWVGIAAASVAVVLITGLVVMLRPASRDAPATMPVKPATSLPEAAALLEVAEQPTTKYRHIRYTLWKVTYGGQEYGSTDVQFQYDVWLPTAKDESVTIFRRYTGEVRAIDGRQPPLDRLVPDGDRGPVLWSTFCMATPCQEESLALPAGTTPAQKLRDASFALMSPYTTDAERAALYRRLAETPEIRFDNGKVSVEGSATEFTIDPTTGRVVGAENPVNISNRGNGNASVKVTYEWTDQRPS